MSATVFDTPLQGRSLIEASAGTGKTYALAGLFARAVIVGRLRVPQVLAVTYTVAATQELHERVRLRLQHAAELAGQWRAGDPPARDDDDAGTALLRRLLHDALHATGDDAARESLPALRLRLARAAREMDLAAITTIHGFCQRVLSEHALDAGQPLLAADVVPANAAQRSALAVELWRATARTADGAAFLQAWFGDVEALARALRDLLAPEPLLPPAPEALAPDPRPALQAAWRDFRTVFAMHGGEARAAFLAAIDGKALSGTKYRTAHIDALWTWLQAVIGEEAPPAEWHPRLERFTREALRDGCNKGRTPPDSPLCGAISTLLAARDAVGPWQEAAGLQRLHALRALARERDAADKRAFHYRDHDDLIAAVHAAATDPAIAPRLSAALRAQFPLVLVDEFQDTDARQWAIFERLFGGDGAPGTNAAAGGLLLVGDPKQAIYRFRGGDVETYLLAQRGAQAAAPLLRNFRSRPCVLAAVNAMFERAPEHALGRDIGFAPSAPGGRACDPDLLHDDAPAPALVFHRVPPRQDGKAWGKPESIRIAARLAADALRDLLQAARAGRVQRVEQGAPRPVQPRDCAVLVRTHGEGLAIREELARRGVPAVSAGRGSLFATGQAQSLLALLLALAAPGDERRLRAALATPLFGFDAPALCALEDDGEALRRWQQDLMQWRLRWEQHGPQAMLADVAAREAARLLATPEGERELTWLLQLGELMQEARAGALDARGLGPQGQIDWLRAAIAHADGDDESQWPRLESDAGRVQILTLHRSKGLEFPLVFLPFAGIGRGNGRGNGGGRDCVDYHDDGGRRVRQWKTRWTHAGAPVWDEACARAQAEEQAEDMRLLYVGLTRARDALWLCGGALAGNDNTALARLLGGPAPGAELERALDGLLDAREGLPPGAVVALPPQPAPPVPPPRVPRRVLRRDWWIHSFSQLHRQRPHGTQLPGDETPADDERPLAVVDAAPTRFGGARFGNALHQALEHADFARWRDSGAADVPAGEGDTLRQALADHGYGAADLDEGVRELALLVARTLNAPLRCGDRRVRLCDLPREARVPEIEFHYTLADTDAAALLSLLHAHGIAGDRRDFGAWPRLAGLMNGKIDLTFAVDGRAYVLDYKSNRLPAYDPRTLHEAMAASEYDLQALLYTVAVHRWLRVRRGTAYDYVRDFGGVHYLFCRGLDASQPDHGVVALQLPAALVEGADALFGMPGSDA